MSVVERYTHMLAQRGFAVDPAQLQVVERLQKMHQEATVYQRRRRSWLRKLVDRSSPPRGVWIWGGVGRGKSFLMDVFYDTVPWVRKIRLHSHEFMRRVHLELRELRAVSDPLDEVAKRIAQRYRLICFDEFHVSDIADAMILDRLLHGLFRHGVTFVMTSNYPPDGLYPDGLHRERVLPAIALLKARLDIVELASQTDYRRLALTQVPAYLTPLDAVSESQLAKVFAQLAAGEASAAGLTIERRSVQVRACASNVVWFDFSVLCGGPRSQLDYLEIARRFDTVVLSGVPRMSASLSSEARRFTWLIDVLYDQKVKLVLSAECIPEDLYVSGPMAHEFPRTVSRLIEMQSHEYLAATRRRDDGASA
jgi:cell division protein ZapE